MRIKTLFRPLSLLCPSLLPNYVELVTIVISTGLYNLVSNMQRCTMDLELRELERASINLIPKIVMMESKTVLTQYIISKWSLEYKTESIKTTAIWPYC